MIIATGYTLTWSRCVQLLECKQLLHFIFANYIICFSCDTTTTGLAAIQPFWVVIPPYGNSVAQWFSRGTTRGITCDPTWQAGLDKWQPCLHVTWFYYHINGWAAMNVLDSCQGLCCHFLLYRIVRFVLISVYLSDTTQIVIAASIN